MKKKSLDLTLRKKAPKVWSDLSGIQGKIDAIAKASDPHTNTPEGYWTFYGDLLKKEGNLKTERDELYRDVMSWLDKHS